MNIGFAIETLRKQKDISQQELALKANVTQSYLSLIENNKKDPNMKVLKEISISLDVPLPFLLLYSMDSKDVPENKKDAFKIIMPLVRSILGEYIKDDEQ